jgi:hypothetical protein
LRINRHRCLAIALLVFGMIGFCAADLWAMDDAPGPIEIQVGAQPVEDARIVIKQVDGAGPAWVVIHLQNADGSMGAVIGYAAVCNGQTQYLPIALDMSKIKPNLIAVLHMDKGTIGKFEFPGEDAVAKWGGSVVETAFTVSY